MATRVVVAVDICSFAIVFVSFAFLHVREHFVSKWRRLKIFVFLSAR